MWGTQRFDSVQFDEYVHARLLETRWTSLVDTLIRVPPCSRYKQLTKLVFNFKWNSTRRDYHPMASMLSGQQMEPSRR
jgi:hypothetical protein